MVTGHNIESLIKLNRSICESRVYIINTNIPKCTQNILNVFYPGLGTETLPGTSQSASMSIKIKSHQQVLL